VLRAVAHYVRRLPPSVQRDDLVANGTVGLLDALRRSPRRGRAFEVYARIRIRGAMVDGLRKQDWLPRRWRDRETGALVPPGVAVVAFDDLRESEALELTDHTTAGPEQQVDSRMQRAVIDGAVARLPEREANLVNWHYFGDLSFTDIATRFGVSNARVFQLHARAMGHMRTLLGDEPGAMHATWNRGAAP
jgi:RNA polymerase sigma factor for flagellar operon FliA